MLLHVTAYSMQWLCSCIYVYIDCSGWRCLFFLSEWHWANIAALVFGRVCGASFLFLCISTTYFTQ